VDEDIFSASLGLDESIALFVVKPLDDTLSHTDEPLSLARVASGAGSPRGARIR
jgi:hypothetical protein